jgi:hypothetical protein
VTVSAVNAWLAHRQWSTASWREFLAAIAGGDDVEPGLELAV